MLKDKYSLEDIAKELGRTKKTVENCRNEIKRKAAKQKIKKHAKSQDPEAAKILKAKDLIVHETMQKKDKGVSVMTEAASARGDEKQDRAPSRMSQGAIYKIDGSDE